MTWEQLSLFTDEELGVQTKSKMTHEELLVGLKLPEENCSCFYCANTKALRAVVELHKLDNNKGCQGCDYPMPCPTIQAIETAIARGQK